MYVVIGGSGFLGGYFLKTILSQSTTEKVIATYNRDYGKEFSDSVEWVHLDVGNVNSIEEFARYLNSQNYGKCTVLYLSAYHKPDEVLKNFDYGWNINITGLSCFLSSVKNIETLYYSSTEMVYGESLCGKIFDETDSVNPINAYGKQKKIAEQLVLGKGYNVVRYPVLMGEAINGKKHFTDQILEKLKNHETIEMLADTYRNMLDFEQAAALTIALAKKYKESQIGIVNVVGDQVLSKYEVAVKLAEAKQFDKCYIKPMNLDNNGFFSAQRAQNLLLSNDKLKNLLGLDCVKLNF